MCCSATAAWSYDAQLGWSPVTGAAGYKIYVHQSGQPVGSGTDAGSPTPGIDGNIHSVSTGLSAGVTNLFSVSAYDGSGAESALSNELSLMVMPTSTPTGPTATATNTSPPTATNTAPPAATATPIPTTTGSPIATATLSSGLVAAYGFSEGSGTTTADASGGGHTGTLFGSPVWTAGKNGSALQFSGGTTYDGVNLTPNNGLDGLTQGTLEAWVKFDTSAAGYHNWFDGRDASGCSYPFEFNINNQGATVYWEVWAGNTAQCTATFQARVALANPSQWHHLAYVVTNVGNTWYVDGVAQTPTYLAGSAASPFFFSSIAASPNTRYDVGTTETQSEGFKGIVDDLRIYNRPLAQAEVQADMNAPVGGAAPTATATQTAKPSNTAAATFTASATATSSATSSRTTTATATPTSSPSRTATITSTATATSSASPSASATASATRTATASATRTFTSTGTASASPTATATASRTATSTATNTAPPTGTATATQTASPSRTATATNSATPPSTTTASATASATSTQTPRPSSTATASATLTAAATATSTAPPAATKTAASTATSTASPTPTATPPSTASATSTTTASATRSATATNTQAPTATSSATATTAPSQTATATRTAAATATATGTNTLAPSGTATASRTATALPSPTNSATRSATPTATQSLTPTPTATPVPAWSVSVPTDATVMPGSTVSVPVSIAAGSGVRQVALTFAFDPSVVTEQDVQLAAAAGAGTLTSDGTTPGLLTVTATLALPMSAAGALIDVTFAAAGACPSSTSLAITSCVLDGGAIGCQPSDGAIAVHCGVGGRIRHWSSAAPVQGAQVALLSAQSSAMATTNDLGQFAFGEMATGTWELQPQKSGDLQGAVTALDAAIVLQAVAGWRQLDPVQSLACDVTGNGHISALDAARILQLAVGQLTRLPIAETCGSDWLFLPVPATLPNQELIQPQLGGTSCQPGGILLNPLVGDAPQQDFTGVLFGDCTGNWSAPAAQQSARLRLARDVRVRLGAPRARGNGQWAVPLYVASAAPFQALDARIAYDPAVRPAAVQVAGVARDAMLRYAGDGRGTLSLALASATPLAPDDGPVAVLLLEAADGTPAGPLARLLSVAVDEVAVGVGH